MAVEAIIYLVGFLLFIAVSSPIWGFNYEKIRPIGRKSYILRVLTMMVVAIVLAFFEEPGNDELTIVLRLALIPLSFIIVYSTVQRTKDAGVSKHWTWTVFLPLVSIVPAIVFMVLRTKAKAEMQAETAS